MDAGACRNGKPLHFFLPQNSLKRLWRECCYLLPQSRCRLAAERRDSSLEKAPIIRCGSSPRRRCKQDKERAEFSPFSTTKPIVWVIVAAETRSLRKRRRELNPFPSQKRFAAQRFFGKRRNWHCKRGVCPKGRHPQNAPHSDEGVRKGDKVFSR